MHSKKTIKTRTYLLVTICLLSALFLCGCKTDNNVTVDKVPDSLADTSWTEVELLHLERDSEMASGVPADMPFDFSLLKDGTLVGETPLNKISGRWTTTGSGISITLEDRDIDNIGGMGDQYLLVIDYSMGNALVNAKVFLLDDDASTLSLYDDSGRMVMLCKRQR
jgi:hypothetical protein